MQQEQIQPDYNYILNQDAPLPPPKKNKVVYVAVIGLIVLGVITIIAVIAASMQVEKGPSAEVTRGHSDAAGQFMSSLEKEEYAQITANQLSQNLTSLSERHDLLLKRLVTGLNIKSCELKENTMQDDSSFMNVYTCNTIEGDKPRQLTVGTVKIEGVYKVNSYKVEAQ